MKTVKVQIDLKQIGENVEMKITENMIIRNGTWHVPIFRVIMTFQPGYGSKEYASRIEKHFIK